MNRLSLLAVSLCSAMSSPHLVAAEAPEPWRETARLPASKTHVVPAMWETLPHLNAKSTVTILKANGPGVVTQIHVSALGPGFDSPESQGVLLRVYYDGETKPSISLPLMDFLADVQCQSAYFTTVYFSKVKQSHNFRLPMPFRSSIRIELENPSAKNLVGYTDVQWDEVAALPENCGYLRTDYRSGSLDAQKENPVFELKGAGRIVAHWLQYESEKSVNGETICEANQEFYLDGDTAPTLNYLGTEDVYGFSWGYAGTHSDNWAAILRKDDLKPAGSRIAVLRCRTNDAIAFQQSCRWILTFAHDADHQKRLGDTPIPFRHCVYYYSAAQH